jgi:transposase-like protein
MRQGFGKMALWKQPTTQSQPMNIHSNARLTLRSREALVQSILNHRLTVKAAAAAFTVSERTAYKWLARYRSGGIDALTDRSCSP